MNDSIASAICGFAAGIVAVHLTNPIAKSNTRLIQLEKKVDLILVHMGIEKASTPIVGPISVTAEVSTDIRLLVQRGQKIQAIKVYRDQHPGVGLKDAKDVIDSL